MEGERAPKEGKEGRSEGWTSAARARTRSAGACGLENARACSIAPIVFLDLHKGVSSADGARKVRDRRRIAGPWHLPKGPGGSNMRGKGGGPRRWLPTVPLLPLLWSFGACARQSTIKR